MSTYLELDPIAERLLEASRDRRQKSLAGRERWARVVAAAAFAAVAVPLAVPAVRNVDAALLAALVGAFALASRIEFEVGSGFGVPTEVVLVPMFFLLPPRIVPLAVALGFVLGQLPEYLRRGVPPDRVFVSIGNAWFAIGPVVVFLALGGPTASLERWYVLFLALAAQFVADLVSSLAREKAALGVSPRHLVQPLAWVFAVDACLAPIGVAIGIAADTVRAAVILPLPLILLLALLSGERSRRLSNELELSHAYRGTAFLLGDVVEAEDAYTGTHSREVVELVTSVCDLMGLDERSRRHAEFAALLHDVGKIRIPAEIINKPGALTPEERTIINTHTIEGENLLRPIGGLLAEVGTIVRSCHERYDGLGYPDGLAGENIPLVARIITACDAYNAMVTDRSYRKARTQEAALRELQTHRGTQFDPDVVTALTAIIGQGDRTTGS